MIDLNKFKYSFSPFQEENLIYFDKEIFSLYYDVIINYSDIGDFSKKYDIKSIQKIDAEDYTSNPITIKLIEFLISMNKPNEILEIGTFVGISTVCMKNVLPKDSKLTFIEIGKDCYDITLKNLEKNTDNKNIYGINGDGITILKELVYNNTKFDFIFMDGGKENYKEYFKSLNKLINKNGIIFVDDIFYHGDIFNDTPKTNKGKGVKRFLEEVKGNDSYHKIILPICNGIMILIKK